MFPRWHSGTGLGGCVRLPHPPTGLERGTQWRRVFRGEGRQLGVLRQWLATLLPPGPARDDLVLVATELASNALCHTASGQDGWFAVEVTRCQSVVRIGVADSGGPGRPRVIDDPAAERGRGLLLVRALAARTGVSGAGQGRLVWADVSWGGAHNDTRTIVIAGKATECPPRSVLSCMHGKAKAMPQSPSS